MRENHGMFFLILKQDYIQFTSTNWKEAPLPKAHAPTCEEGANPQCAATHPSTTLPLYTQSPTYLFSITYLKETFVPYPCTTLPPLSTSQNQFLLVMLFQYLQPILVVTNFMALFLPPSRSYHHYLQLLLASYPCLPARSPHVISLSMIQYYNPPILPILKHLFHTRNSFLIISSSSVCVLCKGIFKNLRHSMTNHHIQPLSDFPTAYIHKSCRMLLPEVPVVLPELPATLLLLELLSNEFANNNSLTLLLLLLLSTITYASRYHHSC